MDTRNRYIPPLAPTNTCGDWTPLLFVEETIGRRQGGAGVKALPKLPVAGLVPVPDEEREVPGEGRVGDGDGGALVDIERAEPPTGVPIWSLATDAAINLPYGTATGLLVQRLRFGMLASRVMDGELIRFGLSPHVKDKKMD